LEHGSEQQEEVKVPAYDFEKLVQQALEREQI
jgi:hypothetical protein